MNETAICSMEGCGNVAETHHALRDRHPFNKSRAQSATGVKWRDEPHLVQNLCREHHFDGFHQKFARTDNWPPGWGFADTPLLRSADAVERIVDRASARPSTSHGNSSDRKLRGRRDDGDRAERRSRRSRVHVGEGTDVRRHWQGSPSCACGGPRV